MSTNYQYLKYRLQNHYRGKSRLTHYLAELEQAKDINSILKPVKLIKDCQYIQKLSDDLYVLRIVEYGQETYRVKFTEEGLYEAFIYNQFGYSNIYGYRECGSRMGYHQEDHVYNVKLPIKDETNLFPYIDLSKLKKANAGRLIKNILGNKEKMYALELIIKSGNIKLAEAYIEHPFGDIKTALKYNSKLLEKANEKRLRLAYVLGKNTYKRGMLSYFNNYYPGTLKKVDLSNWNKIHKYIKEVEKSESDRSKHDILSDYLDYLVHHNDFGLPKYPKDLYKAKENVRRRLDEIRVLENKKKAAEYDKQFIKRFIESPIISDEKYIVRLPKKTDELIDEGKALHHCVGQYYKEHASKDTTIAFVRDKNTDQPYITVEIKNDEIHQMRGEYNKTDMVTKEHKDLVNQMIQELNKRKEQVHA
jgi:hypothetical protein